MGADEAERLPPAGFAAAGPDVGGAPAAGKGVAGVAGWGAAGAVRAARAVRGAGRGRPSLSCRRRCAPAESCAQKVDVAGCLTLSKI